MVFSSGSFLWGGCSDDVKYGMKFAENFIDASETEQHDARASMNRHNNRVGRRVSGVQKKLCIYALQSKTFFTQRGKYRHSNSSNVRFDNIDSAAIISNVNKRYFQC